MPNPISVGIDLGTTFSVAAYVNENGQPEIIHNQAKNNAINIPSVVCYESDTNIVVGEAALDDAEISPERVIRSAKRFIGETFSPPAGVPQDETPVKFQAKVLGAIKTYVEEHENAYEIRNAVITVPAYFDFNKVNLTKEAATIAGINVIGVINEPMAAAIYYCTNQPVENQRILVYDLGGGTFDSVIIEYRMNNGLAEIVTLADDGNHQLGGDDWDRSLMSYMLKLAHEKEPDIPASMSELEPDDRQTLWQKANTLKLTLSKNEEKTISLKIEGIAITDILVTRKDFENETRHLLNQTGNKVDNVLRQANLSEEDIDLVLLVGGSTFMPMVQEYVRGKFGAEKVRLNNPNLAVAYGAAIYAHNMDAYLSPQPRPIPSQSEEDWGIIQDANDIINAEDADDDGDWDSEASDASNNASDIPYSDIARPMPINVVSIASHSVGVRFWSNDKPLVNNMIFKGNQLPREVEDDKFTCMSDGGFQAAFYGNVSGEELIEIKPNPSATSPDDRYIACDSSVLLTYLGELGFSDDRIQAEDPIKVTLTASQDGIFAKVKHLPTEEEKILDFKNKNRLSKEELQAEQEAQSRKVFILD